MKRILCLLLLGVVFSWSGELSDKQMQLYFDLCKKGDYTAAAAAWLDHVVSINDQPEYKASNIASNSSVYSKIFLQHGKPLNYTKWRTRSLSKNWEETVYQINCEKSAWMIEVWEYISPDGTHSINHVRYVTEEDVFKIYGK